MNDLFHNVNGKLVPRDVCARKHGGNDQSNTAYDRIDMNGMQFVVYEAIRISGNHGMTCDEISRHFGRGENCYSGRITELRIKGKIEKRGTRKTRSGCSAAVWVVV